MFRLGPFPAGENVHSSVVALGPGVHRQMRLCQQTHCCDALWGKLVAGDVYQRGTRRLGAFLDGPLDEIQVIEELGWAPEQL